MSTQKLALFLFIIYLVIYTCILIILKSKIKGYSIHKHVVSLLGVEKSPFGSIFNLSTIIYGLLSFSMISPLLNQYGNNPLVILGIISLISTGVATILVGIFPMNIPRAHKFVSYYVFSSVLVTGIIFTPIFITYGLSKFMIWLSIWTILSTFLLSMVALVEKRTNSFLEWSNLFYTILWNFSFAYMLFRGIA